MQTPTGSFNKFDFLEAAMFPSTLVQVFLQGDQIQSILAENAVGVLHETKTPSFVLNLVISLMLNACKCRA